MDKTVRRDWLREAYLIAKGDRTIHPKREHVEAAISAVIEVKNAAMALRRVLRLAYENACRSRRAAGLPVPEEPPVLKKGGVLDL